MSVFAGILPQSDENNSGPKIKRRLTMLFTASAILALTLNAVRLLLILNFIELDTGLYATNAGILPPLFNGIIYVICAACIVMSRFGLKKTYAFVNVTGTQPYLFASALCGFMLLSAFVLQLIDYYDVLATNAFQWGVTIQSIVKTSILQLVLLVFTFPCAVYFFKGISRSGPNQQGDVIVPPALGRRREALFSLFSFCPVVWLLLRLAISFFDTRQLVNTSGHKLELLMLVFLVMFFLTDARMMLGDTSAAPLFFFGFGSIIMVCVSAVPNLVLESVWMLKTHTPKIIYTVEIAFMVYVVAKLYSQIKYSLYSDYENDELKQARAAMKKSL